MISGANSACAGGTTTITASGGSDYEWNTGDLSNSIDAVSYTHLDVYKRQMQDCTYVRKSEIKSGMIPIKMMSWTQMSMA